MEEDPIGLCTQHLEEIGQLDAYVEAESARSHTPGLSLAVICDGTVVARGYGQANVELCVPATVDTVYELASVTKQFTAAAVMRLVEEDKLHLEDRISSYLPNAPTAWEPITVRHLLTNTSGVKDYFVHPALRPGDIFDWRKDVTLEEFVELVSPVPLEFPPGERYAYSNAGFNLLGIIIEKVTGQPYGQFLSERFFQPLGMSATRRNSRREIIPDRAAGYHWDNEALHNAEYTSISWAYAEGGIVSSVADLVKWDAALSTDTVLTAASREQMWTSARLNNGEEDRLRLRLGREPPPRPPVDQPRRGQAGLLHLLRPVRGRAADGDRAHQPAAGQRRVDRDADRRYVSLRGASDRR
jgi:D-alanyl-D-alanine carboxypeptidase